MEIDHIICNYVTIFRSCYLFHVSITMASEHIERTVQLMFVQYYIENPSNRVSKIEVSTSNVVINVHLWLLVSFYERPFACPSKIYSYSLRSLNLSFLVEAPAG